MKDLKDEQKNELIETFERQTQDIQKIFSYVEEVNRLGFCTSKKTNRTMWRIINNAATNMEEQAFKIQQKKLALDMVNLDLSHDNKKDIYNDRIQKLGITYNNEKQRRNQLKIKINQAHKSGDYDLFDTLRMQLH